MDFVMIQWTNASMDIEMSEWISNFPLNKYTIRFIEELDNFIKMKWSQLCETHYHTEQIYADGQCDINATGHRVTH